MSRILRAFPTFHVPESQDQPSLQAHLTTECPNANQVPRPLGSPDPHPRPILQNLKGMRPLGPLMRTDTEPRDLDSDQNLRGPRDRITDMKGPFSTLPQQRWNESSILLIRNFTLFVSSRFANKYKYLANVLILILNILKRIMRLIVIKN